MAGELGHEGLAESHDFVIGLALGVEVRAALAAAHGERGKGVLEDLLEAQELEHAQRYRGVEAQTALVGADSGVELDAVAAVDLALALIVDPGNTEHNDALGLDQTLEKACLLIGGVGIYRRGDRGQDLVCSLDEFGLVGIALVQLCNNSLGIAHDISFSSCWMGIAPSAIRRNMIKHA